MLTKEGHIDFWKKDAERNWETASFLMSGRQFVMALFMFHLTIEKLLKAHWVKDNTDNFPPRSHDLQYLHNQTDLDLPADDYIYLAVVNQWNIDTRYPDYKEKIYSIASEAFVKTHQEKINSLRLCLLEKL
ncbi:MAG: HEPN domain-containing protein [Bacteroidetes bacterium]|nr:HEPN domain-containing protein [Bacteroidota bacterium]